MSPSGQDSECQVGTEENGKLRCNRILQNFLTTTAEEKKFLITNYETIFQESDGSDWIVDTLILLTGILEDLDQLPSNRRYQPTPPVISDNGSGGPRIPWTFLPHHSQYIVYVMSKLLIRPVDVWSRNTIHNIILKTIRRCNSIQVKAALLRFSRSFLRFLTTADVNELILPLVSTCLDSRYIEAQLSAMESLPKLTEYACSDELYEKCLTCAMNAFRNSVFRPQLQSVAVLCIANLLPHLPDDVIVETIMPFALEAVADAAGKAREMDSAAGKKKQATKKCRTPMQLLPHYLVEFDFFLSEGEPVIALCCLLRAITHGCMHAMQPQTLALELIPNLLTHTLAKHWHFSEFKYLMSTLYELLDCLGGLFPEEANLNFAPEKDSNDRDDDKVQDQKICVHVSEFEQKTCKTEEDTFERTHGLPESGLGIPLPSSENRRIQRRGSGNVILPLLNTFSKTIVEPAPSEENVTVSSQPTPEINYFFDSLEPPNRLTSPLSQANLLTVSVCEGPFGPSDVSRRRSSANDLRTYETALSTSHRQGSKTKLLAGTPPLQKPGINALQFSQLSSTNSRKSNK